MTTCPTSQRPITDPTAVSEASPPPRATTAWGPLLIMAAASFILVTAEFLPTGLLTPMAADLGITTGQAAQTVTLTAVVGFLVAPTVAILIPRMDRRTLLAWVTLVAAISNLVVALVPSFWLILASRALLGAAISGFWAMSLAIATRLAPPEHLGRAVMVITVGPSLAIVAGVPIGVIIAEHFGWRATFAVAAGFTLLVSIMIATLVPSIPASPSVGLRPLVTTLTQRGIPLGLAGHVLTIVGHITAFTFIRVAVSVTVMSIPAMIRSRERVDRAVLV